MRHGFACACRCPIPNASSERGVVVLDALTTEALLSRWAKWHSDLGEKLSRTLREAGLRTKEQCPCMKSPVERDEPWQPTHDRVQTGRPPRTVLYVFRLDESDSCEMWPG